MRFFTRIIGVCLLSVAFFFSACKESRSTPSNVSSEVSSAQKKIDKPVDKEMSTSGTTDSAEKKNADKSDDTPLSPTQLLSNMLKSPLMIRYSEPGNARYSILFDAPVDGISWSASAGLTVSSGRYLHNVTTKGVERWELNAGEGHRVFVTDNEEIVWSRQFGSVFQMKRHGRIGWQKPWPYPLAFNPPNSLFMVDAANVSRLGGDGHERWRVTVDDVRKLDGPFSCDDRVLFQGKRGQKSVATVISESGAVVSETELPFGAVVLGASFKCEPIVWTSGSVALILERGHTGWSYPLKNRPLFFRLFNTYLFIVPDAQEDVSVVMVDKMGTILYKRGLPISGRVTDGKVVELSGLKQAIALCRDVSSPCARRDGNLGPYNVLLAGERGQFTVQERLIKGNNGIAPFFTDGFVYAGSSDEDATTLTLYNHQGKILWDTELPGRLSAGPFVGPYGGIYVGTCMGWKCTPPYRFISVTGAVIGNETEEQE
ncbi:MAG: hypothetical protein JXX14_07220 [Deltaproteobacteria bacterium]|nr:hypothetical protein [Deltaproteobacteria bacterium]